MAIKYVNQVGDYFLLAVEGDFSVWDVNPLEEAFGTIAENNAQFIAVDFSKACAIHTSILGPLIKLQRTLQSTGGRLSLCALPADIRFILSTVKLEQGFNFLNSISDLNQLESQKGDTHIDHSVMSKAQPVIYSVDDTKPLL